MVYVLAQTIEDNVLQSVPVNKCVAAPLTPNSLEGWAGAARFVWSTDGPTNTAIFTGFS